MRIKSQEKRSRQKVVRRPTYKLENEYNPEAMPQHFQIQINILESRKLIWSNPHSPNSYVIVVFGKTKHRTGIKRNMEEPCYNEYFLFETYVSLQELQRTSLWLAVMESRCCGPPRLVGETTIDIATVWAQPYHQVYHKWAQLYIPKNPSSGPVGFLKLDISILFRGEIQIMPASASDDKLEDNLLLPSGSEQQRANYSMTVYGAFALPNTNQGQIDRNGKPPSTFVRVTFGALVAKTAVQHRNNNPMYCEQVSMVEMFPNMNQTIRFEVCCAEAVYNRVLASAQLKLGQISYDGENGFLPTFGPSLIHMYANSVTGMINVTSEEGAYHRGALLVSLKTIVPFYKHSIRSINVEPVTPVNVENLWNNELFCVYCPLFEVSMLQGRLSGNVCGVAMTIGEISTQEITDKDFSSMVREIKKRKLHYTGSIDVVNDSPVYGYIQFRNAFPVMQLAIQLPDFRFRMYKNNIINNISHMLENTANEVENRLQVHGYDQISECVDELNKCIDDAVAILSQFVEIMQYCSLASGDVKGCGTGSPRVSHYTELDHKQTELQMEEFMKIVNKARCTSKNSGSTLSLVQKESVATTSRKHVKILLAETKGIIHKLRSLVFKSHEGWPDIVLWLINGTSRIAYCKVSPLDVIYSPTAVQRGAKCGKIQTFFMKPVKCPTHPNTVATGCSCFAAKVELVMWMGLFKERTSFEACLPKGYKLFAKDFDMCVRVPMMYLECRAFIYRAKLFHETENTGEIHPFVRINALNLVKDTQVAQNTVDPMWNEILKINNMLLISIDRIKKNPPVVLVELYNGIVPQRKMDLIGRATIKPEFDVRTDYEYAPKLQWYKIYLGTESTGQILMSVQLLQIPETVLKNVNYELDDFSAIDKQTEEKSHVEQLPACLIPKTVSYKMDVYWWGLRDINVTKKPLVVLEMYDLSIKSEVIVDKKNNCNFPNGRVSQVFEALMNEEHSTPINLKLYDSSTFGRTLYLGTKSIKYPSKHFVEWLPKYEREASLKSASIVSANFRQVGENIIYIVKNQTNRSNLGSLSNSSSSIAGIQAKIPTWRRLFSRKEPKEEEYALLPVFTKVKDHIKVVKKAGNKEVPDWWLRYKNSIKDGESEFKSYEDCHKIKIYDSELELQPEFCKLRDWCSTLKLYSGKKSGIPEKDDQLHCGYLKAGIAIYRWPPPNGTVAVSNHGVDLNRGFFDDYPHNQPRKFIVRVYAVKGLNLMAKESNGKCNPYVIVSCGKKIFGDRNCFVSNTANPIFGKMFEFRCTIPDEYQVTISVYDHDVVPTDELIGSTTIDLENRIYSKHRAMVGLATEYHAVNPDISGARFTCRNKIDGFTPPLNNVLKCINSGPAKWRDCVKPTYILEEICEKNHLPPPDFRDPSTVVVNGVEYKDHERSSSMITVSERKHNICLNLLHKWHTLPICGYHLVPEHVETRTLHHPERPGVDQGKIQMWVDIFPVDTGMLIPLPVDFMPQKLEDFELRVIIWDVQELQVDKTIAVDANEKATDIFVKAWIGSPEQAQYTDVHYRSNMGKGSFNWRMVFDFQYQPIDRKMIVKQKSPFTDVKDYLNPVLVVQVLNSGSVSSEEVLGSLKLPLTSMPKGMKSAQSCDLEEIEKSRRINLFSVNSIRAWWALKPLDRSTTSQYKTGVIDMELTLVPKDKALLMPVGLGRAPPNPLPEPLRPETSTTVFTVYTEKCKSLLRHPKCLLTIGGLILLIFVSFMFLIYFYVIKALFHHIFGLRVLHSNFGDFDLLNWARIKVSE